MSPKRLSEVEADRRREHKNLSGWVARNKHRVPAVEGVDQYAPRKRERVGTDADGFGGRDRVQALGQLEGLMSDDVKYGEGERFVPLMADLGVHPVDLRAADLAARVNHVLSFVPEAQQELLRAAYLEGLSWEGLRNGTESRQAVHQRLARARLAFEKAWLEHAEDPVVLRAEDL